MKLQEIFIQKQVFPVLSHQSSNKMSKNEKKLTHLEAFQCMREFLELYYKNTKSDDVGDILSATQLSIWEDGGTADPACWGEWIQCINKVTKNEKT